MPKAEGEVAAGIEPNERLRAVGGGDKHWRINNDLPPDTSGALHNILLFAAPFLVASADERVVVADLTKPQCR